MGQFTFKTADTEQPIHYGDSVFMLQPKGRPSLCEGHYNGYGDFAGQDCYVWIAENNCKRLSSKLDYDDVRDLGLALDIGSYYEDPVDGSKWIFHNYNLVKLGVIRDIERFEGNFGTVQPKYGKTPNDLIESGQWIEKPLRKLILKGRKYYPLKFSFNKNAAYDKLPASKPYQLR